MAGAAVAGEAMVRRGTCMCGACAVELRGQPFFSVLCHCTICQRWNAAPFTHWLGYPVASVRCVEGEDKLIAHNTSATMTRFACAVCSVPLFNEAHSETEPFRDVPSGILDRDESGRILGLDAELAPKTHIYYRSRVFAFNDNLPKFTALPHSARLDADGNELPAAK